ncbi:MAG: (2Fe-2S)-binding protein [Caldilineaceae bacterium]|nr:(2Fe-2S)-binding protein [Caldilineaceae bacterium]
MQTRLDEHPLQQTFTRIRQLSPYVGARWGQQQEAEWLTPAELLAPQSPHLATQIRQTQARLHTTAASTIAAALLQEYQWPLISTAVASFLVDRRVPNLDPANVSFLVLDAEKGIQEAEDHTHIAYLGGRFLALPDDPAADHPDATTVPDRDALRDALRTGLESHFGWVIERLSAAVDCKPRGLWLYVADRLASTFGWLMQEQDKGCRLPQIEPEFNAVLRVPSSPLTNKKVALFELTYKDHSHVFLDRATCCFWYKADGGDYCTTCPHRTKEDRNERLLKYMAESYEKQIAN